MRQTIAAHMMIKNEDQWVWFAIKSILPYVDRFYITDTGSTDNTVTIIKSIRSSKIIFSQVIAATPSQITRVRQSQLTKTSEDWIWCIDGDEIYPKSTAKEVVMAIRSGKYEGVTVRRYDLLGDIYHRQFEHIGEYRMFGQKGHLVLRCLNKRTINGLHLEGNYPLEGYYDKSGIAILDHDRRSHYITNNYLFHAMYLKRSSQGSIIPAMVNRSKYKIETGMKVESRPSEVFMMPRPSFVPDPLFHRSFAYEILAGIVTPIKNIKRSLKSLQTL